METNGHDGCCPFCGSKDASSDSNDRLVDNLCRAGAFSEDSIAAQAMRKVDRRDFIPSHPYEDCAVPIGFNVQISAPHVHAMVLNALEKHLVKGCSVLDVGSGTGYMCAAMSMMCESNCDDTEPEYTVEGHEHIPELVMLSHYNMNKSHKTLMGSGRVTIKTADGLKEQGSGKLYHAINCGAAAKTEDAAMGLVSCLHMNGRLICPVGPPEDLQWLTCFDKTPDGVTAKKLMRVKFVPLTEKDDQLAEELFS